jgi:hypothetical protein
MTVIGWIISLFLSAVGIVGIMKIGILFENIFGLHYDGFWKTTLMGIALLGWIIFIFFLLTLVK